MTTRLIHQYSGQGTEMTTERYRVNPSNVVFDTFEDGEAAVINLVTGTYYSLTGSAPVLWPRFVEGISSDELIAFASNIYNTTNRSLVASVEAFVAELVREGLIEVDNNPMLTSDASAAPEVAGATFVEPKVERFDDLQELILLDPVHDVSDLGWPHAQVS